MLKKTVTYTDFNDIERTEDHYFHMTEAELIQLETGETGGYTNMIKRISAAQDTPMLMKLFKELLLMSYGIKSADGRRFEKTDEIRREFEQTEAFSQIYMELITDDKAGAEFIEGIVPNKLKDEYKKALKNDPGLKSLK